MSQGLRGITSPLLGVLVRQLAPVLGVDLRTRLLPHVRLLEVEPMGEERELTRVLRCRRWVVESWLPYLLQGAGMEESAHRLWMAYRNPWAHLRAVRRALGRELADVPQDLFDALFEQSGEAEPFGRAVFDAAATGERTVLGWCWGREPRALGAAATALALLRFGALPAETLHDLRSSVLSLAESLAAPPAATVGAHQ